MGFQLNGVDITGVNLNGQPVTEVQLNGVTVWLAIEIYQGNLLSGTGGGFIGYSGATGTLTPTAIETPNGAAVITAVIALQPPAPNFAGISLDVGFIPGYNLLVTWENPIGSSETLTQGSVAGDWDTQAQNTPFHTWVENFNGDRNFTIEFVPI